MFKGAPLNSYGMALYKALKRAEIESFNLARFATHF